MQHNRSDEGRREYERNQLADRSPSTHRADVAMRSHSVDEWTWTVIAEAERRGDQDFDGKKRSLLARRPREMVSPGALFPVVFRALVFLFLPLPLPVAVVAGSGIVAAAVVSRAVSVLAPCLVR